ncbi:PhnA domain-containing protein [Tenacibaculum maritimum]|uniref:PhnA domain-containing protein n=1 Tax=Tenacibaculum maritimum TaxID=107401 RepID=UPI0010A5784C|nr:alkylphosphonate utilization protein [Tenacibaculum maritimum]MCD9562269.1 PhnA domain-containing protein [Tenacibaculum maritimum]MCD9565832.1 PhnA domain-containing protein [Tenacibaculum maritimum]MCD9577969.1 PhnA domain-containing protein [Tenacibaculum maritimum]MCD9585961.1 PhnA domain-containing protein [Tenacibaculum maritimum]MCD9597090.1 PhnA domain-containing protein [Tenacibaculum maritimum]
MSLLEELQDRSGKKCELCAATTNLNIYEVPPISTGGVDGSLLACEVCVAQINDADKTDANHWRCLNDSMWSEFRAVKIIAWRMLSRLKKEGWPQDLLDMLYLEDADLRFAAATGEGLDESEKVIHRDANGAVLQAGDSVVLIKDLKVKGSSMVAKQGTAVRRISLDRENAKYIEGKVGATQIVIVTDYVKKMAEKE